MQVLTIPYPDDLLWSLQQEPEEFEREARRLLAIKLYERGRLSTRLAARFAGLSRSAFFFLLGEHGLSAFGGEADELESDLDHAFG